MDSTSVQTLSQPRNIWSGRSASVFVYLLFYLDNFLLLQTISIMFPLFGQHPALKPLYGAEAISPRM